MNRLTPELFLHSAFDGATDALETRALDFNLARLSAVVINRIVGQFFCDPDTTSGFDIERTIVQELDLDPDNVNIEFAGVIGADAVVIDSSRVFRQYGAGHWDTAAGATDSLQQQLVKDWHGVPWNERPISMTNLRHHVAAEGTVSNLYHAEITIDYFIVELSINEIGVLNSSRR